MIKGYQFSDNSIVEELRAVIIAKQDQNADIDIEHREERNT